MRSTVFLAWCLGLQLLAQREPLFDHITTADGLPGNGVLSVFEDRRGYLWAGTTTGLARMEGTRIRTFHHDRNDSSSLAHDQVNALAEDGRGTLWLATMAGLSKYDPVHGNFTSYRVPASGNAAHQANRMLQVLCVGDTLIWVVSEEGVFRFDARTEHFSGVEGGPIGTGPPGRVNVQNALCWDDARQGLWAGSTKGLAFWDARKDRWTDHRNATPQQPWFNDRFRSKVMLEGRDTLWCYDERGRSLVRSDLSTGKQELLDSLERGRNAFTIKWQQVDGDGRHWISLWTHRLLYRDRGSAWREVVPSSTVPAALRSGNVSASVLTRSGERWFATPAGIAVLRPANAALSVMALPDNERDLTEVFAWNTDTLLIGTAGNGVHRSDLRSGTIVSTRFHRPPMPNTDIYWGDLITDISRRDERSAWLASTHLPIALDVRTMRLAEATEFDNDPDRFTQGQVSFIRPDREGRTWLGTWNKGLFVFDPKTGTSQRTDTSGGPFGRLASRMMLDWLVDSKGRYWLGMNDGGGLACLENGRFRAITDAAGGNVGGVVRCLAEAPDGTIWLGTHEEGIVIYDPADGTTRYLNRKNGLPGVRIGRIHFDRVGTAWVCTAQGVARMTQGAVGFTPIALPDGLEMTDVTSALTELPDGRIVFAVGKYLVFYDQRLDRSMATAPRAVLTSVRVNDLVYHDSIPPGALRLKAAQKALTLELGAVGHAPHATVLFRYRLAEDGSDWAFIGSAQRIDLFDLPTGEHLIEVEASANGVDWSVEPATIQVVVLPPFWATWWFIALVAAIAAALLFVAFRLYLHERLRKQREAFQREQAILQERVRIAGDMHDDLGAGLSALKLRSEMALRVEKDPQKREQLGSLANTAGDLIGSMRQIIWTMNADQTSVEDLVVYTTSYARTYCEQNGLAITVEANGPWPEARLSSEQRRNMFLVVKEALHNTVKHAHATSVDLCLRWSDGVEVVLCDNGVGLPKGTEDAVGNGLRNMRKRITSLGGTLSMNGDQGTRIRFRVPVGPHP
jgi:signal transduction histidine kinase/ligand-binding sensor domain-containing protein